MRFLFFIERIIDMKRISKYIGGLILGTILMGSTALAVEYTVTDAPAVLYTNDATVILADADAKAQVIISADAIASGLPIQVTGVTSNGYFQIVLNGATYYVAGAGLQAAPTAQTTAPAQNTGKKYTCVIEPGDEELYYEGARLKMRYGREDCTDRSLYIFLRDMIEQKITSGQKTFTIEYTTHEARACAVGDNLLIDVKKSHPEFNTTGSEVFYDFYATPYDGFYDNGDRDVTIELHFSTKDDIDMSIPVEGEMTTEEFREWMNQNRGQ